MPISRPLSSYAVNPTENYYGGLAAQRPITYGENYSGQPNGGARPTVPNNYTDLSGAPLAPRPWNGGAKVGGPGAPAVTQPNTPAANRISVDANGHLQLDGQTMNQGDTRMWGSYGQLLGGGNINPATGSLYSYGQYDPNHFNQVTTGQGSEGGQTNSWEMNDATKQALNGRVQVAQRGVGGPSEVIDPSKVQWDDTYGMLTDPSNIAAMAPDSGMNRAIGTGIRVGAATAAGWAGGLAGGTSLFGEIGANGLSGNTTAPNAGDNTFLNNSYASNAGQTDVPVGEAPYSGLDQYSPSGNPSGLPNVPPVPPVPPSGGSTPTSFTDNYVGDGSGTPQVMNNPTATPDASGNILNNPLLRAGGQILGGLVGINNSNRTASQQNAAVAQADPSAQYRGPAAAAYSNALLNPSTSLDQLRSTPGYQFTQQQGEQAIQRAAAGKGYFRSPNMLYDLSTFNTGLADKTYQQYLANLAPLAGVNQNPANAANLANTNAISQSNMRQANYNQLLNGASSFYDWLKGV